MMKFPPRIWETFILFMSKWSSKSTSSTSSAFVICFWNKLVSCKSKFTVVFVNFHNSDCMNVSCWKKGRPIIFHNVLCLFKSFILFSKSRSFFIINLASAEFAFLLTLMETILGHWAIFHEWRVSRNSWSLSKSL